jgi:hypothetical protein
LLFRQFPHMALQAALPATFPVARRQLFKPSIFSSKFYGLFFMYIC